MSEGGPGSEAQEGDGSQGQNHGEDWSRGSEGTEWMWRRKSGGGGSGARILTMCSCR